MFSKCLASLVPQWLRAEGKQRSVACSSRWVKEMWPWKIWSQSKKVNTQESQNNFLVFHLTDFIFPSLKNTHDHISLYFIAPAPVAQNVSIICKCIKQSTATFHFRPVIYSALTKPRARLHALLADRVLHQRDILGRTTSRFVHPVESDRNGALHLGPGDLGQVLGVEDEEVSWPLGAGSHHDGQQYSWGRIIKVIHGR